MKAVIQTQFLENYGAHDWDGEGECPQRWKPKGGDTYIIDMSIRQNMDPEFWAHLMSHIEYSNDYAREYSVGETVVDDIDFQESDHVEHWESPKYLEWTEEGIRCVETRVWDEWRHDEIAAERCSCVLKEDGSRVDHLIEYILKDGREMTYSEYSDYRRATA